MTITANSKQISNTTKKSTILNIADVSNSVLNVWNNNKVQASIYNNDEHDENLDYANGNFSKHSGHNFENKEHQIAEYSLNYLHVKNSKELRLVQVFLAPGFSFASLSTVKRSWCTDVLPNDEFIKEISKQIASY